MQKAENPSATECAACREDAAPPASHKTQFQNLPLNSWHFIEGYIMEGLMSIVEFCAKLGEITEAIEEERHEALERAAKIVEREAKKEIGHYQEGGGGMFGPWPELAQSTQDERVRLGYSENDPGLRSGDMRESIGHQVHGDTAIVGSADQHLVYFELGTEKQPPRSVLGLAAQRKAPEVAEILGREAVAALVGKDVFNGRFPIPLPPSS